MDYQSLYEKLGLPSAAVRIGRGVVPHPSPAVRAPFECYGFPPALIPLWSDGSGPTYCGYWRHWFADRRRTIVYHYVEEGRAYEVARDIEQLVWYEALKLYDNDYLRPGLEAFVRESADLDLGLLEKISEETGDAPEGLKALPAFGVNSPLEVDPAAAEYTGDFPHDSLFPDEESVRRICTLEVSEELKTRVAALSFAPEWFTTAEQPPVFHSLLAAGDLGGAWMSLNSSGWSYLDAKKAIIELSVAARSEEFSALAEAWVAQPHEDAGGY